MSSQRGSDGCLICDDAPPCNCDSKQECITTVRLCDKCPENQCIDKPSSDSSDSGGGGGGPSAASIAGPVVGGIVAGIIVVVAIWWFYRRRQRQRQQQQQQETGAGDGTITDKSNSQQQYDNNNTSTSQVARVIGFGRKVASPHNSALSSPNPAAGSAEAQESSSSNNEKSNDNAETLDVVVKRTSTHAHRSQPAQRRSFVGKGDRDTPSPTQQHQPTSIIVPQQQQQQQHRSQPSTSTSSEDPFDDSHASIRTQNVPITFVPSSGATNSVVSSRSVDSYAASAAADASQFQQPQPQPQPQEQEQAQQEQQPTKRAQEKDSDADTIREADRQTLRTVGSRRVSQSSVNSEGSRLSYLIDPPQISMAKAVNLQTPQGFNQSSLTRAHSLKKSEVLANAGNNKKSPPGSSSGLSAGDGNNNNNNPFGDENSISDKSTTPRYMTPVPSSNEQQQNHPEDQRASMHSVSSVSSSRADSMLEGIPFMDPSKGGNQNSASNGASTSDVDSLSRHRLSNTTFGGENTTSSNNNDSSNNQNSHRLTHVSTPSDAVQGDDYFGLLEPRRPFAGERPHSQVKTFMHSNNSSTSVQQSQSQQVSSSSPSSTTTATDADSVRTAPDNMSRASIDSRASARTGYGSVLEGIPFHLALTGDLDGDPNASTTTLTAAPPTGTNTNTATTSTTTTTSPDDNSNENENKNG